MRRKFSDFMTNLFVPILLVGMIGSIFSGLLMFVAFVGLVVEDALHGW